jgi:MFS family permease
MTRVVSSATLGAILSAAIYGFMNPEAVLHQYVSFPSKDNNWNQDPASLFDTVLLCLVLAAVVIKLVQLSSASSSTKSNTQNNAAMPMAAIPKKPKSVLELQCKFLPVFWLLRISFWMSGPYFYAACASKSFHGIPASVSLISQISLTQYAAIALFGPLAGKLQDKHGRKRGTICAAVIYSVASWTIALPTDNPYYYSCAALSLPLLFVGRALGGIGTCLLGSAPEAWLISESKHKDCDPQGIWLSETFEIAYAFDSVLAIGAGQLAGWMASRLGPTGPFQVSPLFLILGAILAGVFWNENKVGAGGDGGGGESSSETVAGSSGDESTSSSEGDGSSGDGSSGDGSSEDTNTESNSNKNLIGFQKTLSVIRQDSKILLLGAVQSLFEAAMYIFVLQWPPTVAALVKVAFGQDATTPYGTVFSCFMASCLLGSSLFGVSSKMKIPLEISTTVVLGIAAVAMGLSVFTVHLQDKMSSSSSSNLSSLTLLMVACFIYEACVGVYFPSMSTLRSKYLPDSHRSAIMALFAVPVNILVVAVFLFIHRLGSEGALSIATGALFLGAICMARLVYVVRLEQVNASKVGSSSRTALHQQQEQQEVRARRSVSKSILLNGVEEYAALFEEIKNAVTKRERRKSSLVIRQRRRTTIEIVRDMRRNSNLHNANR